MSKEQNLYELKVKLYEDIGKHIEKTARYENLKVKLDMLSELLQNLDICNYTQIGVIFENLELIDSLISACYSERDAEKMITNLFNNKYLWLSGDDKNKLLVQEYIGALRNSVDYDLATVIDEIRSLRESINKERYSTITSRTIMTNLKYGKKISYHQVEFIKEYMNKNQFTSRTQVLILDSLRSHNYEVQGIPQRTPSVERIIKTQLYKFDITPEEELLYSEKYETTISKAFSEFLLCKSDAESIQAFIEYLPSQEFGLKYDEFNYIYKTFFNRILNYISDNIQSIQDIEIYLDLEMRNTAILDFNETYKKYSSVYFYYKQERDKYRSIIPKEEPNEISIDSLESSSNDYQVVLLYVTTANGISYLEKDLKSFPEEYLEKVKDLLENKKTGQIAPGKDEKFTRSNNRLKKYAKLKDDQVRIVYRHLKDNIYLVLGGTIKKTTDDYTNYYSIVSRDREYPKDLTDILEENTEVEASLYEYLDSNARKIYR